MTTIAMTAFAAGRHFMNPEFGGTKVPGTPEHFLQQVADAMLFDARFCEAPRRQVVQADGFAPFVRHFFIKVGPDFAEGTLAGVIATEGIEDMLQTGYETRREGELPYLARWFPREHVTVPQAVWLDLVCYTKAQLKGEGIDIGDADWGIVSINSEPLPQESPPAPATLLRNALGVAHGGNGVPVDRELFAAAVDFWTRYASVR